MRIKIIGLFGILCSLIGNQAMSYAPTYEDLQKQGMIHHLKEKDLQKKFIETSAGKLAYYETSGTEGPLVLIHGNSCSKEYMIRQLDGLGLKYKMYAFDLPGHGESENARHPSHNYTLTGYAKVIAEAIRKLKIEPVIVVGWSLGGHIGIEMMKADPGVLKGVLIASTAAFTPTEQGFKEAYLPTFKTPLSLKLEPFTQEDVKAYITQGAIDFDQYRILMDASLRAHGLARHTMVHDVLRGEGVDEKKVVETSPIPLGIIMGAHEHAINNDYVKSLKYKNCKMIEAIDAGHDCQWSHPKEFNELIERFVSQLH